MKIESEVERDRQINEFYKSTAQFLGKKIFENLLFVFLALLCYLRSTDRGFFLLFPLFIIFPIMILIFLP